MAGTSGAERRYHAFFDERLAGADITPPPPPPSTGRRRTRVATPASPNLAEERRRMLHEVRQRSADATPGPRRRRSADAAARTPAQVPGKNWVPIGPAAVTGGQATGRPVVSGRVQDLAVSRDGRRVYAATANGGVWRSLDAGDTWEPMSDEHDLDVVARQVDSLSCGALALVEGADAAHDRLYLGTGEGHAFFDRDETTGTDFVGLDLFGVGMLRSDDGGATWVQEASAPSLVGASVYAVAVDPADPEHAVAATTIGVYRRTAAVPTWTLEPLPPAPPPAPVGLIDNVSGVAVARNGGRTEFYAVRRGFSNVEAQVFSSSAPGAWAELTGFPAGARRCSIAAANVDPPVVYVLSANDNGGYHGINRYNLGRAAPIPWEATTDGPSDVFGSGDHQQGGYDQGLVVDPNNPDTCYIGGSGKLIGGEFSATIYRVEIAADGGPNRCSHTLIGGGAHADVHALVFRPGSSSELWAGTDGGVWRTNAATGPSRDDVFTSRNVGLATLTLVGLGHHPVEEAYAFCGAQDNGGLRYQGDEVWDHQLPGDGGATVVDWNTGERLLSIYHDNSVRRASTDGSRYSDSDASPGGASPTLFYPPMVGTPPSANAPDAAVVAFGADNAWISTNFGGGWTQLPARVLPPPPPPPPPPAVAPTPRQPLLRSLCLASASRLYGGWTDGAIARWDLTAAGWTSPPTMISRGPETRAVTSITVDPDPNDANAVFATLGGALGVGERVWHRSGGGAWNPVGAGLPDVQANTLAVDPADRTRRWVGTDLGVWQWNEGASRWDPFSFNLPDAAVLDLDLLPGALILRATTYGRGVWEIDVGPNNTPAVELVLRTNRLDTRRRPARAGVKLPGDLRRQTRLDESPDIVVDAPDRDGAYAIDPSRPPTIVSLLDQIGANTVLASVPEAPAITRVHVVVRNRGVRPANPALDGVRVALLVGPAGDDDDTAPTALPAGYEAAARNGTPIDADGWKTVGIHTMNGLKVGRPGVATFELPSTVLPVVDESDGKRFVLLALVHHDDDPFPANPPWTRWRWPWPSAERRCAG